MSRRNSIYWCYFEDVIHYIVVFADSGFYGRMRKMLF